MQFDEIAVMRENDAVDRSRETQENGVGRRGQSEGTRGSNVMPQSNQSVTDSIFEILIGEKCGH